MYVARRVAWRHFAPFALRSVVFFITYSTAICTLYMFTGWPLPTIPFVPIATIGTAVAFYVGFKNNSSYDRLWEGRRIWGSIVNANRSWSVMVHDFITDRMVTDPMSDEALREAEAHLRSFGLFNGAAHPASSTNRLATAPQYCPRHY